MGHNWKLARAQKRIATRFAEVREVEIIDYTREMSLENIPPYKAYRMQAAHIYVDIVNLDEMLACTDSEGETCHKRTLRFLNQHYRAVHRVLQQTDALRVDFHNQRLHAVVTKPYGDESERKRIARAVAIGDLISKVLAETGDADALVADAQVRIGIDSGQALVVNNGRKGGREPLFLGRPANQAAHCAGHDETVGIYLTHHARSVMGFGALEQGQDRTTALTTAEIEACIAEADLGVSKDKIIQLWREEHTEVPLADITFSHPTPPIKDLDFENLTLANSKRFDGVSIYADIDGFSTYVDQHLEHDPENLVRTLHVLRSELDAVVHSDFQGRRIRYIGDCLHGLVLEGNAKTTDVEETISTAALCAAALRSGFNCALDHLQAEGVDTDDLGLAIGFEFGPLSVTRLGMKGDRIRCSTGRAVLASEIEQMGCQGAETAIGPSAYRQSSEAVQRVFGSTRKIEDFDFDVAVTELSASGDRIAKAVQQESLAPVAPAIVSNLSEPLRPHAL